MTNIKKEKPLLMANLENAITLALKAHSGQTDKAGQAYILHPLRLMLKFQDKEEQIVAILHDVVEDSAMTLNTLKENGFSDNIISAIECLTKRDNEDYLHFVNRVKKNQLARKVKIEDIKDNMDLKRLNSITDKDLERITKYHKALNILLDK